MLRRFEAFGVSTAKVVAAQALVTLRAGLRRAPPSCSPSPRRRTGSRTIVNPVQTVLGLVVGTLTLVLLGVAVGLAAPTARAAQAIGLLAFFPLYLLGGGGPPKGVMTGPMQSIADALPSAIPAISDPWLGVSEFSSQLAVLGVWAAAALALCVVLARRTAA